MPHCANQSERRGAWQNRAPLSQPTVKFLLGTGIPGHRKQHEAKDTKDLKGRGQAWELECVCVCGGGSRDWTGQASSIMCRTAKICSLPSALGRRHNGALNSSERPAFGERMTVGPG